MRSWLQSLLLLYFFLFIQKIFSHIFYLWKTYTSVFLLLLYLHVISIREIAISYLFDGLVLVSSNVSQAKVSFLIGVCHYCFSYLFKKSFPIYFTYGKHILVSFYSYFICMLSPLEKICKKLPIWWTCFGKFKYFSSKSILLNKSLSSKYEIPRNH
jgi:hypothetical protein